MPGTLHAAQAGVFLGEVHAYWIDYCISYSALQVMLEFGRRLVAEGTRDEVDDIFYVTFNEVRATPAESPRLDLFVPLASRFGRASRRQMKE